MRVITTYEDLLPSISDVRVQVIEGARCTGKDHLIARLTKDIPDASCFEILKPRKRFVDDESGSVKLPAGMSVQHGHLWSMDCLRQLPGRFIVNRGMLSGQYFDKPDKTIMEMWVAILRACSGKVILLHPDPMSHASRIRSARRSAEATSIYAEKAGLQRLAMDLPEDLVLIFSEKS